MSENSQILITAEPLFMIRLLSNSVIVEMSGNEWTIEIRKVGMLRLILFLVTDQAKTDKSAPAERRESTDDEVRAIPSISWPNRPLHSSILILNARQLPAFYLYPSCPHLAFFGSNSFPTRFSLCVSLWVCGCVKGPWSKFGAIRTSPPSTVHPISSFSPFQLTTSSWLVDLKF